MIKTEGKLHDEIVERLKQAGEEVGEIAVAALRRGTDRLVLQNGEVIGEYNHRSKKLVLYKDIIGKE